VQGDDDEEQEDEVRTVPSSRLRLGG
jgi:hypothetical protein